MSISLAEMFLSPSNQVGLYLMDITFERLSSYFIFSFIESNKAANLRTFPTKEIGLNDWPIFAVIRDFHDD